MKRAEDMTADEIRALDAGPLMDALVWRFVLNRDPSGIDSGLMPGPKAPSTDMRDAWAIVQHLCGTGRTVVLNTGPSPGMGSEVTHYAGLEFEIQGVSEIGGWWVYFGEPQAIPSERRGSASGETAMLAICRAALLACGLGRAR